MWHTSDKQVRGDKTLSIGFRVLVPNVLSFTFRICNFNLHCLLLIITPVCYDSGPIVLANISKINAVTILSITGKQAFVAETTSF